MQHRPKHKEGISHNTNISRKTKIIAVSIFVVLIIVVLIFLGLPKNCKNNEECFNEKVIKCSKVKAILVKNENQLNYYVIGRSGSDCVAKITMAKVSEKQNVDLRKALEGRSMDCAVPMDVLKEKGMNQVDNIYDYCTGPLKEAFLDITLQKMYDLVVKNLGTLTSGLQQVLNQSDKI